MQTQKGAVAKAPTKEEFLHVMQDFKGKAAEVKSKFPHVFAKRAPLRFSFDNPPIHNKCPLQQIGIEPGHRAPLPPRSPDMHKVLEHIFGTLTRAMNESLARDPHLKGVAKYKEELERLFMEKVTAVSVNKDVLSLRSTYEKIIELEGDWPPAKFR